MSARDEDENPVPAESGLTGEIVDAIGNLTSPELEVIDRLAKACEFRDQDTADHIQRMARIAGALAIEAGLGKPHIIQLAAPMHDIGKIRVPDGLLFKPGRFRPEEYEVVKLHARDGFEMLKDSAHELTQMAASIALAHHERWDGAGYPQGLEGAEIPIEGRIAAIADAWDAMTSDRVYRRALLRPDARHELDAARGKQFDPDLVDVAMRLIDSEAI